jgi:predicted P-loop ATPase
MTIIPKQSIFETPMLSPDRDALATFSAAIFKNTDPEGFVSLRAFDDGSRDKPPLFIDPITIGNPAFLDVVYERAKQAAAWHSSVVFCPPIVTFATAKDATTENIHEGVTLSVDCDASPNAALSTLQGILGEPTLVIASGGEWPNPNTGEIEPKLHLHWRLRHPTKTAADHELLREARALAAKLVGGDATAGALVHPLRWPGSVHRKNEPKLVTIVSTSDNEIDLVQALDLLRAAELKEMALSLRRNADRNHNRPFEKPSRELIVSALAAVPNDLDYYNWIKMGYALRDGLGVDGLDVWREYSAQFSGNKPEVTDSKWKSFAKPRPSRPVTISTLFYWARENGWRPPAKEWMRTLRMTDKGTPRAILANAIIALRLAPDWCGALAHNAFTLETSLEVAPPWHTTGSDWTPRVWGDHDDLCLANWLQLNGISVAPTVAAQAVEMVAKDRIFHPVQDYLDGIKYDGINRVDTWLTDYLGAEATPYNQAVGRAMLIGAIARIRNPGCKVDTVPILEGPQGALKSTAMAKLFDPWFTDEISDLGSKDAAMQISGVWGIELPELDAMSRPEMTKTKAFLSRKIDRYRPPYGRRIIERPRPSVCWGTTNAEGYLKDETGGRRFWPIKIGKIDLKGLEQFRDQLWAEAQVLYDAGAPWWFVAGDIQVAAEQQQRDRYVGDVWDEPIGEYVTSKGDRDIKIADVLLHLGVQVDRSGQTEANRVARVLKSMGLRRAQRGTGVARRWVYAKPLTENLSAEIIPIHAGARTKF